MSKQINFKLFSFNVKNGSVSNYSAEHEYAVYMPKQFYFKESNLA